MAVKFLVTDKTGDHLPYTDANGNPDHRLMGAAWAALFSPKGFEGNKYDGPEKEAAQQQLKAIYKSEKMQTPSESFADGGLGGQWVEVFRTGDYGEKGSYGENDLDSMVANYDAGQHEAPAVLGHPENDAPAYGWVEGLKRTGNTLLAKFKQLQPQFEDMVKDGRFKKRSISFYRKPDGSLSLRHVGFLGAMPPEVKGLADVKFGQGKFECIEFNEENNMDDKEQKSFYEALKNFFTGDGRKNFSDSNQALGDAVNSATKPLHDTIATLQARLADLENKSKADAAGDATKTMAEAAIQQLKINQKWIPAFDRMSLPQIFSSLAANPLTVEFGEGDKKTKKTTLQLFSEFLESLPKLVPGGKLIELGEQRPVNRSKANEIPGRIELDESSVVFAEAAAKRATEKNISLGEAGTQLRAEGFDPSLHGSASAGQV